MFSYRTQVKFNKKIMKKISPEQFMSESVSHYTLIIEMEIEGLHKENKQQ